MREIPPACPERSRRAGGSGGPLYLTLSLAIFVMLSIPAIIFDYFIITQPEVAPFPASEREMYIDGGMSGYAVRESIQFIGDLAEQYPQVRVLVPRYTINPTIRELYLPEKVNVVFQEIATPQDLNLQILNDYAQKGPLLTIAGFDVDYGHALILADGSNLYDNSAYPQTWQLASFLKPGRQWQFNIYQWLSLPDFAIHWFQQGGDPHPRVVWFGSHPQGIVTDPAGTLLEWPSAATTFEVLHQHLSETQAEYILVTPELVNARNAPDLLGPFIVADGGRLHLNQLPPGWRLAFAHPDLNCQWCLFQLRPPEQPTYIKFGENITLVGYDLSTTQLATPEAIHLTLYWDSLGPVAESYVVFVHLLDSAGNLIEQLDTAPLQGKFPTQLWRAGDKIADRYTLTSTSILTPGTYTLRVGLYNPETLDRLPVIATQMSVSENAVNLATLSIR